jgi:secondary thiamine-phosphate synthase enzyme
MSATSNRSIVFIDELPFKTGKELDILDITSDIRRRIPESGVIDGSAHIFIAGQTAAITTIEYESGAVSDLRRAIRGLAPDDLHYEHDARWGDGNGRSHVRAALVGPDLTVPVRDGSLVLGTWQQIILVELDTRGRNRTVHLTVSGKGHGGETIP